MVRFAGALIAIAVVIAVPAQADSHAEKTSETSASQFIGSYDGSEMEVAMGMVIREDGTFNWGVSVGALDMRAAGTWTEEAGTITFTSDPKPVPPEFGWSGYESVPDGRLLRIVWASNGEPFQYGSVRATCANGEVVFDQVYSEGWSPPENCDAVETVQLSQDIHEVRSQIYDLKNDFPVVTGETIRFEFRRNDMGVADFSGVVGRLDDGVLTLQGARWPMELRKLAPRDPG